MTGRKYLLGLVAAGGVAGFVVGCNEASPKLPPSRTDSGQVITPSRGGMDSASGPTRGQAGASVGTDTTGGAQDDSTIRSGRNTPASITNDRETRTIDRGGGVGPTGASGMGSGTPPERRSTPADTSGPRSAVDTTSGSGATSGTTGSTGARPAGSTAPPRSVPGETSTDTGTRNDRSGNSNSRTSTGSPNGGGNSSTGTEDQLRNR